MSVGKPLLLPITLISSNQLTLNLSLLTSKRCSELIKNPADEMSSQNCAMNSKASDDAVTPQKHANKAEKDLKEDGDDGAEGSGKKAECEKESAKKDKSGDIGNEKAVVEKGTFVSEEEAETEDVLINVEHM